MGVTQQYQSHQFVEAVVGPAIRVDIIGCKPNAAVCQGLWNMRMNVRVCVDSARGLAVGAHVDLAAQCGGRACRGLSAALWQGAQALHGKTWSGAVRLPHPCPSHKKIPG